MGGMGGGIIGIPPIGIAGIGCDDIILCGCVTLFWWSLTAGRLVGFGCVTFGLVGSSEKHVI